MTTRLPHAQNFAAELDKELFARLSTGPITGVRPKRAATLILIDRSGPAPKVLMGLRHAGHKFMPGKFVFPGGRLEPTDRLMSPMTLLASQTQSQLMACMHRPTLAGAKAVALAAIRETFEETGLLLGTKTSAPIHDAPPGVWQDFA